MRKTILSSFACLLIILLTQAAIANSEPTKPNPNAIHDAMTKEFPNAFTTQNTSTIKKSVTQVPTPMVRNYLYKTPIATVLLNLYMAGYYGITGIKYKEDFYEVTGVNDHGKTVKAYLSTKPAQVYKLPDTIPFSKTKPEILPALTMLQVVVDTIGTRHNGFTDIREANIVSINGQDFYHITACNYSGKQIETYTEINGKGGFGETGFQPKNNCGGKS